jgi:hypothetical protein
VGKQVAQSIEMIRIGAANENLEKGFDLTDPILESTLLADAWLKGDHRPDELRETNKQRPISFERQALMLWHHMNHPEIKLKG